MTKKRSRRKKPVSQHPQSPVPKAATSEAEPEQPTSVRALFSALTRWHGLALVAILLLGLALRLPGVNADLPYQLHPDESVWFLAATQISHGVEINAELAEAYSVYKIAYSYPPVQIRFLALQRWLLEAIWGPDLASATFFAVGRSLNVILSLVGIILVFLIATLLSNPVAGLLAAAFLAVNPTFIGHSYYAIADTPVMTLSMLCVLLSLLAARFPRRWYAWGGLVVGLLAVATKYNVFVVVLLPLYVMIRYLYRELRRLAWNLIPAALCIGGTFWLLATRYHMFDIVNVPYSPTGSLFEKSNIFSLVSAGPNLEVLVPAIGGPLTLGIIVVGLVLLAADAQLKIHVWWEGVGMLVAYGVLFFLVMALFVFSGIRHFVPLIASLAAVWAVALWSIVRFCADRVPALSRWMAAVAGLACLLLLVPGFLEASKQATVVARKDTRAVTADWFIANVPEGGIVVVEYDAVEFLPDYGGYPGPQVFQPVVAESIVRIPVGEYRKAGVRYLVADERAASKGGYFAFSNNPDFNAHFELVLDIPNEGRPGPARRIFEIKDE
ncbi:MAG: glycosyltransferase family 39 protein [Chloroflexota bacterium]|nr:glycosyltransferase family 39 protein [Chloroflexota bacterium]